MRWLREDLPQELQAGVLSSSLLENGDVRVSILPKGEKVLVLGAGPGRVAGEGVGAGEANMGQCSHAITDHDPAVIENFLEFRRGFGALMGEPIGFATQIDWIERSKERLYTAAWC